MRCDRQNQQCAIILPEIINIEYYEILFQIDNVTIVSCKIPFSHYVKQLYWKHWKQNINFLASFELVSKTRTKAVLLPLDHVKSPTFAVQIATPLIIQIAASIVSITRLPSSADSLTKHLLTIGRSLSSTFDELH